MDTHREGAARLEGADAERTLLQLQMLTAILDRYREPLFVIDQARSVIFNNTVATQVLDGLSGFSVNGGRLQLGSVKADSALREMIQGRHLDTFQNRPVRGIRVSRPRASRDWLVLVHPLPCNANPAQRYNLFFIQAMGRSRSRRAPFPALRDLFSLTGKETAVAVQMLQTGNIRAIARKLSLSSETIRSHLKRIFRKCDVHSQGELMLLLHWLSEFPGGR